MGPMGSTGQDGQPVATQSLTRDDVAGYRQRLAQASSQNERARILKELGERLAEIERRKRPAR